MRARALNLPYDQARFEEDLQNAVIDVVHKQVEVGIDIPNDGEYGRAGFTSYIHERLSGLTPRALEPGEKARAQQSERAVFPEFFDQYDRHARSIWMLPGIPVEGIADISANQTEWFRLTGSVGYIGQPAVQRDISLLKSALTGLDVSDAFITAVTPVSRKSDRDVLEFYPSESAYLYALADAMQEEYQAITGAGLILQLDYAALNPQEQLLREKPEATETELRKARELSVEVVNHALRGIPEDQVRYHHCWGSANRPHTMDVPLSEIAPQLLKLKVQAYGVEAANARHEHEWMVWKDLKLPEGKILIPGLVSQSTNVVEHPELIAWRIKNFASVVGKENIIVGTDCGFSQSWDHIRVHPSVQWAKLKALADGAALASKELWAAEKTLNSTATPSVTRGRTRNGPS
jgi:5-methyltetrahydropteroyltriglutamate--homocysteine methyltransferase